MSTRTAAVYVPCTGYYPLRTSYEYEPLFSFRGAFGNPLGDRDIRLREGSAFNHRR